MTREEFVTLALLFAGSPAARYRGPATGLDPAGFDCSGFVNHVLRLVLFPELVPRHANELFDTFGALVHDQYRLPGDLVFISNRDGTYPDHVGILMTHDQYIHSPGREGRFVEVRDLVFEHITRGDPRQVYAYNPIGFKRIMLRGEGRYQRPFLE